MKHLSTLLTLLPLICFCSGVAYSQSPQSIAQEMAASTVILEITQHNGRRTHGTGFFIGAGLIATNAHVIDNAAKATARLVQTQHTMHIEGYIAIDTDTDLAVLKAAHTEAPALTLGNSDTIRIGDLIYTLGNPSGLEGTFSEGRISNLLIGIPGIQGKVIQFTAPISGGSSGGAIVNQTGEVIGIASQTRHDGQNLNFAIPSNALKQLRQNTTTLKPLSQQPHHTKTAEQIQDTPALMINFIILSAIAFCVLHFLPLSTSENIKTTLGIAIGIGLFKTISIAMLPTLFTETMLHLYQQPISEEPLSHILDCGGCLPPFLMKIAIAQTYLIATSILLASANRYIPKIQIQGFFITTGIAAIIIVAEFCLYRILPIG